MRLTVDKPDLLFFSGDHHFGHDNIRKFCDRPFADLHEMNKALTEKWNAKVPEDGIVIHVGDVAFRDGIGKYRQHLNGRIVVVLGNHDPDGESMKPSTRAYFWKVCDLLYLRVREGKRKYQSIMACHFAMRVWDKSHFNAWHVYGHSHASLPPLGKSWDVGVDNNDYAPVSYAELRDIMTKQPDNPNLVRR